MHPLVCVILVNWNGKVDTLACLESLMADQYEPKQVLVIDNGSTDGSAAAIRSTFPSVEVIDAGRNLGFTGGNNLGLKRALELGAEFVYLLNNDTVSDPAALGALVEAATHAFDGDALFTPVIHYFDPPQEAWFAGARLDMARGIAVHDNSIVPGRDESPRRVPWISGCALLIRTGLFRSLGGLDDRFFLNWEDVDLCLRAADAGHAAYLVPAARVYHKVGRAFASAGTDGWYYHVRNHLLLAAKHGEGSRFRLQFWIGMRGLRTGVVSGVRARSWNQFATAWQAIFHHVRGRYGRRGDRGHSIEPVHHVSASVSSAVA